MQTDKQEDILQNILDNTNCSITHNGRDYLVLIKKQKNKDYCTLFLTDCSDKFWIEKMDIEYCEQLKEEMNVKTKTELFAKHFVESLKNGAKIESLDPNAKIKLQLKISEGLTINCPISLGICIDCEENPVEYKQLIRSFFKQLYEAKENQINELKLELQRQKDDEKNLSEAKISTDKNIPRTAISIPERKDQVQPTKNRDLINPYKKKRRAEGMKLTIE